MENDYQRIPFGIYFEEQSSFKDTYAGSLGGVFLEAHLLKPARSSKTVTIFSHPVGGGAYLPMVTALARAGHHVIYCNTRYRGNDSALLMEKCVVDLGACVRYAREKLGYDKVVFGGWSGGGSLSLFYQAEAEDPSLVSTPAGDPPDLTRAGLIPVDGIMLLAAHVSRARTLTEWIDPSILDEQRPEQRDPELDLYDPKNPNQPPYDADYVARYRAAQIERNRRITSWVRNQLDALDKAGKHGFERGFVTHGTMADPRFLDPTIDPNQRKPRWCYLGDPEVVNDGPVGLARFSTLRAWLSQWSYDESRADGVACGARISVPVLVIGNLADDACTPSHTHRLYEAVEHVDRELIEIDGATHYYFGQPEKLSAAVAACGAWLEARSFV
jgi:pimeloyl-ACP methyl ester carboxylesterase